MERGRIVEGLLNIKLFTVAFICYFTAILSYLILIATEKKPVLKASIFLMIISFVFHTLGIVFRIIEYKHPPLANMYEFMTVLAWFACVGYFVTLKFVKNWVVGALNGAVIFMLIVAASLLPKEGTVQLLPALRSYWLQIHVTLAAASEGAFAVGFASSILYLVKSKLADSSRIASRLPDIKLLDTITYRAIAVGYPLFTIGALFAGAIWAHQAWGSFWSWDPKETCSLVVWIIYSAYLHVRIIRGSRGTIPHLLSIAGFTAAILTFFSSMILGGLHSYK